MKLLSHALLVSIMVGAVNADQMVRVIFNNGVTPTEATFCDVSDSLKIDFAFRPIVRVRYLRETTETMVDTNVESTDIEIVDTHVDRELWPAYCKNNCAGYAPGTCRATGCVGYRRRDRRQAQTLSCSDHSLQINALLDDVMTKVSSTCAVFLNPVNRKTECYDDVIYGVVENFVLWKSPTFNTVSLTQALTQAVTFVKDLVSLGPVVDGFTICHYDRINIEAVVNSCVKTVTSTLTGPNGFTATRTDNQLPYTIFGEDSLIPTGRNLPVAGTYTFTAVPDNFDYKKMSITFRVKKC
jgi:hypothetical protein